MPCAWLALVCSEITNHPTNTTKAARRNWTMLQLEEEEATTRCLGNPILFPPPSRNRSPMRTRRPTAQTETPPCRAAFRTRKCRTAYRISQHRWTNTRRHQRRSLTFRNSGRVLSRGPISSWLDQRLRTLLYKDQGLIHITRARNRRPKDSGQTLHHN